MRRALTWQLLDPGHMSFVECGGDGEPGTCRAPVARRRDAEQRLDRHGLLKHRRDILQQIQEKYDLHQVKKDQEVLRKSVKLLQALAQYQNHLQEQPWKTLVDILSEVLEATLQEMLPEVLSTDLDVMLSCPEQLGLFLLAQQKVPSRLKKLVGSINLVLDENVPRPLPPTAGEHAEDGSVLREEEMKAARCCSGAALPGTRERQVSVVLEGSGGTGAAEAAVLASQVHVACGLSQPPFLSVKWGWTTSP
ncbi:hypothetical protein P7K49_014491 [Saguinus oedipus]|uniref:Uncharacterized protein n=1 Tax=Saguinus oedipus TaxID=9490 RepID=A0ABQ9VJK4_SAGOE|nr:hypothetical protein P7K49_014491 [Saguinus oedipus]